MPNYISKINVPGAGTYDIKDANALPKTTEINEITPDSSTGNYTLYGDDINISTGYTPPSSGAYVAPAVADSLEEAIGKLAYGLNQATAGSITSVDEDPTSHLDITTVNGAVTVDVATGYVIPPDTVQASASGGSTLTLVSTGDKYTWDSKQDAITAGSELDADLVDDSTSTNKFVTETDISNWNDKQDEITFDGTYDASTNPAATVSTVTDATADLLAGVKAYDTTEEDYVTVPDTKLVAGNNVTITPDVSNETITIAATDTTYSVFNTSNDGLVPAADGTGETAMFLKGDGTWATPPGTTYTEGTGIDISNSDVISNTGVLNVTTDNTGSTANNGTITISKLNAQGTAEETSVAVKGLANAAYKGVDSTITDQSTSANVPTSDVVYSYVQSAISGITGPMIFKGAATITADSTDTTKCSISVTDPASSANIKVGYTYKITTIASSPAYTGDLKVGDVLIAKINNPTVTAAWVENTDWTIVPSGDDVEYPKLTYIVETEEGQPVKYIGIDYGNIN